MIHAAPDVDFVGALQVESLEIGLIQKGTQPIPAVRFVLHQNQPYTILAAGQHTGEIYAYCDAALDGGMGCIEVKIMGALLVDVDAHPHILTTSLTWYAPKALREQAAARRKNIYEKGMRDKFKVCDAPFMTINP